MNKKIKANLKKIFIVLSIVISIVLILNIVMERPTHADSGFSTSHSSSHSSSSHSSGYSSSSHHSSGGSGGMSLEAALVILVIYIIIAIISKISQRATSTPISIPRENFDDNAIENKIKQYIPDFNKEEFLNNGYSMYCDIQKAWMDFKLEDVKDMLTDELYTMYESQLATLEVKGEQNIMKDFVLKRSYLKDVINQNDTITITTGYIIEFYDYIAEQGTGKVIRGESKRKMRVTYEMKFRQTLDQSKKVDKCPNCGAPVEVNSSGFCSYCRTKLVTENTKWVLTEKQALNQIYL